MKKNTKSEMRLMEKKNKKHVPISVTLSILSTRVSYINIDEGMCL